MSVNSPGIIDGGSNPPEVINTGDFTELLFTSVNSGFEAELNGPTGIVASKPIKNASVTINTERGESTSVGIQGTKVQKSEFIADGRGSLNMNVTTGQFKKNTVVGTNKADSVSFGSGAKINKSDIDLKKGKDTITFGAQTKFQGKTTVDLGKGSKDMVEFKAAPTKGKIVFDNVDKRDRFTIDGETYTGSEVADNFSNIKINFAD